MSNLAFCERRRWGAMQQPSNTISGLSFLLTALVLTRVPQCEPYAYMMILLALCTAWMHATGSALAGRADMASMFLCIVYSLLRNVNVDHGPALAIAATVACVPFWMRGSSMRLFVGVTALWILSYLPMISKRVVMGYVVFLVSVLLWKGDKDGSLCRPHSPHQGHAWWHVGSALGFALLLPVKHL